MTEKKQFPIPAADGLKYQDAGSWAETKYRLIALYDKLFSSGMKYKWDKRVYIDLYAGAGIASIKETGQLVYGSPLLALLTDDPFDKYIFCEADEEKLNALEQRTKKLSPNADVTFIRGDCNEHISEILKAIPAASSTCKVLSLCFVDPNDLGIKFGTIQALSAKFMDFLVLLALNMDANRNYSNYLNPVSSKVAEFLCDDDWRTKWQASQSLVQRPPRFPDFLAERFAERMKDLKYLQSPRMKEVRLKVGHKNVLLYHLAIFSKNERAYSFWDEVLKYSTDQMGLDF